MLETDVYVKTDAGRDEIRSRSRGLSMALRAILLMVDGQRDVASMRAVIAGSKAPPDVLDVLLAQGLIETRDAATRSADAPLPPPAAAPLPPAAPLRPAPVAPAAASVALPAAAVALGAPTDEADRSSERPPSPFAGRFGSSLAFEGPLDLVLPTIVGPNDAEPAADAPPSDLPPVAVSLPEAAAVPLPPSAATPDRYNQLYAMMNEVVRDFLAPHRRYFFQLKIERCGTAADLMELLHELQTALAKARGDAFASDVISRLRSATA